MLGRGVRDGSLGMVGEGDRGLLAVFLVGPSHLVESADAVVGHPERLAVVVGVPLGLAVLEVVRRGRAVAEAVLDGLDMYADGGVVAVLEFVALPFCVRRTGHRFQVPVRVVRQVGDGRGVVVEVFAGLAHGAGRAVDGRFAVA